jgi:large subunit ribosomal protein L21
MIRKLLPAVASRLHRLPPPAGTYRTLAAPADQLGGCERNLRSRAASRHLGARSEFASAPARALSSIEGGDLSAGRHPRPEPQVLPLPDGVDGSRIGLFEIVGTEGTGREGNGKRAIFGVHGPREHWIGGGDNLESASGGSFAVIELAGRQYRVVPGDVLYVNRIPGEVNASIVLDKVVLIGSMLWSVFGRPYIPGAVVKATVESQTRTAKVIVTKFKKRKGYLRRQGHRQPITRLHIDSVDYEVPDGKLIVPHEVPYDPRRPPLPNNTRYIC